MMFTPDRRRSRRLRKVPHSFDQSTRKTLSWNGDNAHRR